MPINARYLGLVLFILGSWLSIVVDVFILLDSRFSRKLMAVGGDVAVWLNCRCRVGKCRFSGLLVSHHMVVRSSEGSLKFSICGNVSWQAKKFLVKQLSTWSLATAKVWVQGGTRSSSWQSHWCHPRAKYFTTSFFLCSWRGLKTSFWISAPSYALDFRPIWGHRPIGSFEEDWDKWSNNFKHLWKLEG
jgi:hypothetical protein